MTCHYGHKNKTKTEYQCIDLSRILEFESVLKKIIIHNFGWANKQLDCKLRG